MFQPLRCPLTAAPLVACQPLCRRLSAHPDAPSFLPSIFALLSGLEYGLRNETLHTWFSTSSGADARWQTFRARNRLLR
ncbi:hypothetical protein SNOG_08410 [Parastagonospora nodorum SN15]|uniref:Uncharacterized protein n=1 Tax=Phaeosphaeria nodorum (strain SN15 / ATCC MYA-4574 / FGSC 10173) TaxID=321614 RepID=Q0UIK4_PHANO|nr:hypothetical protein SNOG_08410 [Parastagonospora nodorum SN15]EAT84686.1 hypothetical protein SNOG_08410 [Parastagonospora nodorum SN15]